MWLKRHDTPEGRKELAREERNVDTKKVREMNRVGGSEICSKRNKEERGNKNYISRLKRRERIMEREKREEKRTTERKRKG
jgi:hypothetical protein